MTDDSERSRPSGNPRPTQSSATLSRSRHGRGADGAKRLKTLREEAGAEDLTSESWIDLEHAIAVAAVPTDDAEPRLRIDSVTTKPMDRAAGQVRPAPSTSPPI